MNKILTIIASICLLALSFSAGMSYQATRQKNAPTEKLESAYINKAHNYSIHYPKDWTVNTANEAIATTFSTAQQKTVNEKNKGASPLFAVMIIAHDAVTKLPNNSAGKPLDEWIKTFAAPETVSTLTVANSPAYVVTLPTNQTMVFMTHGKETLQIVVNGYLNSVVQDMIASIQ